MPTGVASSGCYQTRGCSPVPGASSRRAFLEHGVGIERLELGRLVLDHRDVLAAGLAIGLVLAAGDVHRHLDHDFRMELHLHLVQAEVLDRLLDDDLALVDAEAARGDHLGHVARRDRAVELARVAGLADRDERLAGERGGDLLGLALQLEVARFELHAALLELGLVVLRRAQRLAQRQQEIARVAVLDLDDVAHLTEPADALQQNDLHVDSTPLLIAVVDVRVG